MNITYLGPEGATFSAIAYRRLAELCGGPTTNDPQNTLALASANEDILPILVERGGYGAIAMETKAEGLVGPPVNSFIQLLRGGTEVCPIQILGALRMRIHFALMVRPGTRLADIKTVIAHPKAIGACRQKLKELGVTLVNSPSNGKAAEDVSKAGLGDGVAALGPIQAVEKYGLEALDLAFEDTEAVTTFFYLGPRLSQSSTANKVTVLTQHRALSVFQVKHQPGALVEVLQPFAQEGVNLRLIHSLHVENGTYHFAIETESLASELAAHERAIRGAQGQMEKCIQFGPFPVFSE